MEIDVEDIEEQILGKIHCNLKGLAYLPKSLRNKADTYLRGGLYEQQGMWFYYG